ncbi:MAG: hypothetical protein KGS72_00975 [Cyanobacteria bacterium REEB67]|nr:hypothetical protein [Cyanobacteria bacterium REEB67]
MSGHERHSIDAPASAGSNQSNETSHNLLSGIWGHVKSAAGDVKDGVVHGAKVVSEKAHEVASDPEVQAKVHKGAEIAGQMGRDVAHGVVNDYAGARRDAQNGNYAGVAERAIPIVAGGGIPGLVVEEVAPHVLKAGMNQLPAETRHNIESSSLGRVATQAVSRGEIPTSTSDVARMVISHGKRELVHQALDGAQHRAAESTGGQYNAQTQRRQAAKDAPANSGSPSTQTASSWFNKIQSMEAKTKH